MLCGRYNENYKLEENRCFDTMNKYMMLGKTIYIFVNFNSYIIEVDPKTELQDSLTHTTGLLLHPSKSGKYSAFHFNPHGQAGIDVKQYELYVSRWRKRTVSITQSLDIWMITEMINNFNIYSDTGGNPGPDWIYPAAYAWDVNSTGWFGKAVPSPRLPCERPGIIVFWSRRIMTVRKTLRGKSRRVAATRQMKPLGA